MGDPVFHTKWWRCNYDQIIETFNNISGSISPSGFANKSPGDIEIHAGNNEAVRVALAQDAEDLAVFDERYHEPLFS